MLRNRPVSLPDMLNDKCVRQHQQNAHYYYIYFTVNILQLQHLSTLFRSSSGSIHQLYSYVKNIDFVLIN